jgi:BirA family biotin operon repressor/biotin-[acetyl-CoA-carboxylase] ligase
MKPTHTLDIEILKLLRSAAAKSDGYCSGQSISNDLSISRNAVWKHISGLRKLGYTINGSSRLGYKLSTTDDPPFSATEILSTLQTEYIGQELYFYQSIESTNARAMELAREGAAEGTVVIAETQSKGMGRLGRSWHSPANVNLYTSIILRPNIHPGKAQLLTLLTAAATAKTIEAQSGIRPTVKWPNDIMMDGKKVAGILALMSSETDRVNHVVIGIGININMEHSNLPSELNDIATSIRERRGTPLDRAAFTRALYSSLETCYKGFLRDGQEAALKTWKKFFDAEGKHVKIRGFSRDKDSDILSGICEGIDNDGALLLRLSSGKLERVVSGDFFC